MKKEHTYQVDTKWEEGRTGIISSPQFGEKIKIATPPRLMAA